MAKKKKEKKESGSPGKLSRIGLPVVLIVILGLAAMSFIALGMLRRSADMNEPKPQVESKVTGAIETTAAEAAKPAFPPPPPILKTGDVPAPVSTAAPETTGQPETTAAEPAGQAAATAKPTETPAVAKPAPKTAAVPTPLETAAARPDEKTAAPQPAQPETTVASAAPPPDPAQSTTEKVGGEVVPRPRWQSVGQEWEGNSSATDPEAIQPAGAAWKQINIGDKDRVTSEPVDKSTPKAPVVATNKPSPPKTSTTPAPSSNTAKTRTSTASVSKTPTKSVARSRSSRRTPKASNSPHVGLVIINETGRPGQGEAYRNVLQAMGYRVDRVVEGKQQSGPTTILYGTGLAESAAKLATHIPGRRAISPKATSGVDIVILVR